MLWMIFKKFKFRKYGNIMLDFKKYKKIFETIRRRSMPRARMPEEFT